jgi:hypothetical protein
VIAVEGMFGLKSHYNISQLRRSTDATSGAGTTYPSEAHEFNPGFVVTRSQVTCETMY